MLHASFRRIEQSDHVFISRPHAGALRRHGKRRRFRPGTGAIRSDYLAAHRGDGQARGRRGLPRGRRRHAGASWRDENTRYSLYDRHSPARLDRELSGHQFQGRLEIPPSGGLPGAARVGHPPAANPRHAGRQLSKFPFGRYDHVHHRRDRHGTVRADRGGQRSFGIPVWSRQSVRDVQFRIQTSDRHESAAGRRDLQ